ncbi:MAG: hypothetical protein ACREQO_18180 [Candidatus Binatia bacterium]
MEIVRKLTAMLSLSAVLGLFLIVHSSYAQAPAEPAKVQAPAAGALEVKKEDPGAAPAQFTQGLMEQIGGAKVAMDTM